MTHSFIHKIDNETITINHDEKVTNRVLALRDIVKLDAQHQKCIQPFVSGKRTTFSLFWLERGCQLN